jgi:hypothetical protein
MYATCLFCNRDLGHNTVLPTFPVGRRLAFDPERGRLWVVCTKCDRWNLTPLEERWEAVEECERLFRATRLRYSTGNVGLAQLRSGLDLVRIGRALRPEIAAWRYGRLLGRWLPGGDNVRLVHAVHGAVDGVVRFGDRVAGAIARAIPHDPLGYDPRVWLHLHRQSARVVDVVESAAGRATIRYRHLEHAALTRPERGQAWQLVVPHDAGVVTLTGTAGLRTAGRLLAGINRVGITAEQVDRAVRKIEDAGNPDDYFNRVVVGIALRTSWGRIPFAPSDERLALTGATDAERIALYVTSRSFWGRGAIGSEPRTLLPQLPLVDRLALEMAAHEDIERRAMEGELAALEAAWAEAEEIAAIADNLVLDADRALDDQLSALSARLRRGGERLGALRSAPAPG